MVAYPIVCIIVLEMNRDRLDDPDVQAKIKNMYININAKRTRYSIFAYPIWILRRLFFVLIPLVLARYPSLQIMFLTFSDVLYVMYYTGNKPHNNMRQRYLELGNEVILIGISYHLFCFTWFVLLKET